MLSMTCKKTDFRAQTLETKIQRDLLSNKWDRLLVYGLNDMLLGFHLLQNSTVPLKIPDAPGNSVHSIS